MTPATPQRRLPRLALGLGIGLLLAACGTATPSTIPGAAGPSVGPSASAADVPSQAPASANPTPAPVATASPTPIPSVAACQPLPPDGTLPSDRLTGLTAFGLPGRDVLRFSFGDPSLEPAGVPTGQIEVATPPFTEAGSGRPIALDGSDALKVVFRGMSIMNDVGQPVFDGERELRTSDPSRPIKHVVMFDESEGQIGWYIGYDGPACPTLTREGNDVVLALEFGPGS